MIIESGLSAPADMQGRVDMSFGPLHDLHHFRPVVDFFKRHALNGSAGDDKTVVIIVTDLIEGLIKFKKMVSRCILGDMRCGLNQIDLDLKRRVGQTAEQLRFRRDFGRHQIEQTDFQRTDVLCHGTVLCHHEYVFALQNGTGGETVFDFDWHNILNSFIFILLLRLNCEQTAHSL